MKDYSQDHEQEAILKVLGINSIGAFLDIGAWNAKDKSNTRALFELEWSGVMIEPSPGPLLGLVEEYGNSDRVTVIGAAVGPVMQGLIQMRITNDAVSTSNPEIADKWKDAGGYIGSLMVPVITIEQILNQFGRFDFVNIDAEGLSVDLLKVLLATEMFPRCICCEHDDRLVEAMQAAQARGYKAVFTNQANVIFSL